MTFMCLCPTGQFDWIRTGRQESVPRENPNWRGIFVSNLLPPGFEAYVKILHRIDAKYGNIDNPLSDREIVLLKIPACTELRSFVQNLRGQGQGSRVRWRSLARLLNVPFEPEICHEWFRASLKNPECWPRFLWGPADGTLTAEELAEVLSILKPFTGNQDCFFRFSEIEFIGTNIPIAFCGTLDELLGFLSDGKYQFTPEYWWPAGHSWCLCTDYDLMFTIVAGPRSLISALSDNPTLEILKVERQTRIDSRAPMPT